MKATAPSAAAELAKITSCIHCGLCLGSCPTYQLTGDENNSPRGRLAHWRGMLEGRLEPNPTTDFYLDECVGCLACETACPAKVPYGEILHTERRKRVENGKPVPWWLRLAAKGALAPSLFQLALMPARALRSFLGLEMSYIFPGRPAVSKSSAEYAREVMAERRPTGPRVALLSGCLMEGLFREINFATIRVLAAHNVQVIVPKSQTCCGALHEHAGLNGVGRAAETNRAAFDRLEVDAVIANAAGCGLALRHALKTPVVDISRFLSGIGPRDGAGIAADHIYVDLPCHLVHGQKEAGIPSNVLDAIGTPWTLAPMARECCGSGGVYNQLKPENAREILRRKSAFLDQSPHRRIVLASGNHVCLQQWHAARSLGLVHREYRVAHIVQLLDESLTKSFR